MIKEHTNLNTCRGFTLLEALLGFLILSIGMLGIASLQAIALKSGRTSVYGSVAMMKVDELFEAMRANPGALVDYTGAGANNNCTGVNNCTETELAQEDILRWRQNLATGLPGAPTTNVILTAPVAPSKMATVRVDVSWNERDKDAGGSVSRTYTTTASICTEVPC